MPPQDKMKDMETVYILGSGAIGLSLAAHLAEAGRPVVAVRTSRKDVPRSSVTVIVHNGKTHLSVALDTVSLSELDQLDGIIVLAAKSHANEAIALELKDKVVAGPVVMMQNGIGVERPFIKARLLPIYRCVLYATSQAASEHELTLHPIASSPIGTISGDRSGLEYCVRHLTTEGFPFHAEDDIQSKIWQKAIINCVFNSICPLLEVDNGVFARDEHAANLARELVRECLTLSERFDLRISEGEVMEMVGRISKGSNHLISTLQDIRAGRPTEVQSLNLEMARLAASLKPKLELPKIELLGKMILAKSLQPRNGA